MLRSKAARVGALLGLVVTLGTSAGAAAQAASAPSSTATVHAATAGVHHNASRAGSDSWP